MTAMPALKKNATGLIIALVLAAVAGVFVFLALRPGGDDDGPAAARDTVEVVRATQDIPASTEITTGMVEVAEVPRESMLSSAYTSVDTVLGQRSRIPVYQGEQLLPSKLVEASQLDGESLSFIVPDGMRAMAVHAEKVKTAGGLVRPGDRVDVIAVMDIDWEILDEEGMPASSNLSETLTFTVGQNIEVLAVEQELQRRLGTDVAAEDGTLVEQPENDPDATVVTLALTPELAQAVLVADERGHIRLAVRGPGDTEVIELEDTTMLSLAYPEIAELIQDAYQSLMVQFEDELLVPEPADDEAGDTDE